MVERLRVAHNLPRSMTTFIGRDQEITEISALLEDPDCHLLTIVGQGGIGKTRLALEATAQVSSLFSDGVYIVPLQSLNDPGDIATKIIDVLPLQLTSEAEPTSLLLSYLRERSMLLLLDNFEQLLDGVELINRILNNSKQVQLLVTSRERLNLYAEQVWPLQGLDVPSNEPDSFVSSSAVQLFDDRARRVQPDFILNDHLDAVADICRTVEGMPLALELAASWVHAMSCEAIAEQIRRNIDILTARQRDLPARHQSVRAVFDHSWQQLHEDQRAAFGRLSVFRGGITAEAAQAVAGASLKTLALLIDKSLVQIETSDRYSLHELLRQFATDKLLEVDQLDATNQRHCDFFLSFATDIEKHDFGREQIAAYDRAGIEFDNIRAALAWSVDTEKGLQIAAALGWFFSERGHWSEGLDWIEQAIAANPNAPISLRAKAHHRAAALAGLIGDHSRMSTHCKQAFNLAHQANDQWNIAWTLSHQAVWQDTDLMESVSQLEESITLFRELGDVMGLAHSLVRRAWFARDAKDFDYTRRLLEEAAIYARDAGDRGSMAWVSYDLGKVAWHQDHNLELARTRFQTSLTHFREARINVGIVNALMALAQVELVNANLQQAQSWGEESLSYLWKTIPDSAFVPGALQVLASIAKACGQFVRAATLLGATNNGQWVSIFVFDPEIDFDRDTAAVRTQLGEAIFDKAWAEGSALTCEQAIAYALDGPEIASGHADVLVATFNQSLPDPLSQRELEVLALVAADLTNREIAEKLFVGISTVKKHINHIYSKLDVQGRNQAINRARDLHLVS